MSRLNAYDVSLGGAKYLIAADTSARAIQCASQDCDDYDIDYDPTVSRVILLTEYQMRTRMLRNSDTGNSMSVWELLVEIGKEAVEAAQIIKVSSRSGEWT